MAQPKGFINPHFPNHMLYLKNTLYGLKHAPRAWYDWLTQYLVSHRFTRGKADQTLFIKREDGVLIVAQVFIDDIIYGTTKDELAHSFSKLMQGEFEMSMIRALDYKFVNKIQVYSYLNLNMLKILLKSLVWNLLVLLEPP